jgi:hypothetical protein
LCRQTGSSCDSFLIFEVLIVVSFFWLLLNFFVLQPNAAVRAYDGVLFESIFCVILSILFALGRGGIDAYSLRSAATAAATDAICGTNYEIPKTFRKDKWKPQGFPRAALVLLVAGLVMLMAYFLTL